MAEQDNTLFFTSLAKGVLEILFGVAILSKTRAIELKDDSLNIDATINNIALFAVAFNFLMTVVVGVMANQGKSMGDVTKKVSDMARNGLTQLVLVNAAFQYGYNADGKDTGMGDAGESSSLLTLIGVGLVKVVLEPVLDLGSFGQLVEVHCEAAAWRNRKRMAVALAVAVSLGVLSGDIIDKGGLPDQSEETRVLAGITIGLEGLHLLLLLLGIAGACGLEFLRACAFGDKLSGGDKCEDSSFHGLNEIPLIRSIVVTSATGVLAILIGDEAAASKNMSILIVSLAAIMFADSLGRNVA